MDCVDGAFNVDVTSSGQMKMGMSLDAITDEAFYSRDTLKGRTSVFDDEESGKKEKTCDSGICLSTCSTTSCDSGICNSNVSRHESSTLHSDVCQVEARVQRMNIAHETTCQHEHLPASTSRHSMLPYASLHKLPGIQSKKDAHRQCPKVFRQDEDGDTTLHIAIINKLAEYSFYLISQAVEPACVNIANRLKQTPLHLAVMTGQPNIVRRLVDAGADVDRCDHNGNTPLHHACRLCDLACVQQLVSTTHPIRQYVLHKNYEGDTCLHLAATAQQTQIIIYLTHQCGLNVNEQEGRSGRTVLHQAVETENVALVRALLSVPNIDVNTRTFAGYTALDLAFGRGFDTIQKLLSAAGGRTNRHGSDYESDSDSDSSLIDFD